MSGLDAHELLSRADHVSGRFAECMPEAPWSECWQRVAHKAVPIELFNHSPWLRAVIEACETAAAQRALEDRVEAVARHLRYVSVGRPWQSASEADTVWLRMPESARDQWRYQARVLLGLAPSDAAQGGEADRG